MRNERGKDEKFRRMSIRRGIPLALFLVFSSALIFQMFLYTYVISLMRNAHRLETLRVLAAVASRSGKKGGAVDSETGSVRTFHDIPALEKYVEKTFRKPQWAMMDENSFTFTSEEGVHYVIPVTEPGSGGVGYLLVSIPHAIDSEKITLIVGGVSLAFIFVLFGFTLVVFTRYLFSPLGKLVEVVERFERGEGAPENLSLPPNELGKLGEVLLSAFSSLEGKRKQLEEMVGALREANEELRRSRNQMIHMEKLATIGRLASGIAHEVGNPLMSIKGYAEYLLSESELDDEQRDCLLRVVKESERIEGIVKGLLQHARVEVSDGGKTDVNALIKDILKSLRFRKFSENVELKVNLGEIPQARISEDKLRQVLVNVILNALDAMPEGGVLAVSTRVEEGKGGRVSRPRRRRTDPPDADFTGLRKEDLTEASRGTASFVVVEISDTGVGIKREEMDKIFDPFYTTKEPGKGTGLGLSISSAILSMYDGFIECRSEPGEGSTFMIFVPACEAG